MTHARLPAAPLRRVLLRLKDADSLSWEELAERAGLSSRHLFRLLAKVALAEFERLGAPRDADAAAAFLRDRGVAGRTGPKGLGLLSKREQEVLALLGQGLTNSEIAARLFISTKTAGNHVSNVLAKLHLRSRAEAAAYAVRYLNGSPAEK